MRFALIPENNSLSHVLKCVALQKTLVERGLNVQSAFFKILKKNKYEDILVYRHKLGLNRII